MSQNVLPPAKDEADRTMAMMIPICVVGYMLLLFSLDGINRTFFPEKKSHHTVSVGTNR